MQIGHGGFADVYRARQIALNRDVAVKILRAAGANEQSRMRFTRECHAVGAVSGHPNIVGVHEGGFTEDGRAYLVMELCPGGSLADRIARSGPLGTDEVIDVGIKIAKALGVAHAAGVVHRDVKPGNILITAWGEPALADFGIARVEGGQETATGQVTASLAHAAPEVLEGGTPTPLSDLYSLGSTLFELFTGYPPHFRPGESSVLALMRRVLTEPIPDPVVLGMPRHLAAAVQRSTAIAPERRFASGADMATALVPGPPSAFDQMGPAPESGAEPTLVAASSTWTGPEVDRFTGSPPPTHQPTPGAQPGVQPPAWAGDTPGGPAAAGFPPSGYQVPAFQPGGSHPPGGHYTPGGSDPGYERTGVQPQPAGGSGAGRWVAGLVAAVALVGIGIGGAAWWSSSRDAGTPTGVIAGGTTDGSTTGSETPVDLAVIQLQLDPAAKGPLDLDKAYPVSVVGGVAGATYQLVVDEAPIGSPTETLTEFTPASPGRHAVAARATVGSRTVTSDPIQVYVIGAVPKTGYRANLQAVTVKDGNWANALAAFDQLTAAGHTNLQLLPSERFATLKPGYWNLFVPGFDDRQGALDYCAQFGLAVPGQCFAGRFDPAGDGA